MCLRISTGGVVIHFVRDGRKDHKLVRGQLFGSESVVLGLTRVETIRYLQQAIQVDFGGDWIGRQGVVAKVDHIAGRTLVGLANGGPCGYRGGVAQ